MCAPFKIKMYEFLIAVPKLEVEYSLIVKSNIQRNQISFRSNECKRLHDLFDTTLTSFIVHFKYIRDMHMSVHMRINLIKKKKKDKKMTCHILISEVDFTSTGK